MHCGMKRDSMDAACRLVGASRHDDELEPWSIGIEPLQSEHLTHLLSGWRHYALRLGETLAAF